MFKITPNEIPSDLPEVDSATLNAEASQPVGNRLIINGKNMFVTLKNGEHKIGRIELVGLTHFTVGTSDPIYLSDVQSAREV